MVTVNLTPQQCAVLVQLINSVSGVENQRVLIPIHDAIQDAVKKANNGELRPITE
jgi:hypothetical protein